MSERADLPEAAHRVWPRGGRALLVVVLLGTVYLGYARALDGELQFDDLRAMVANPALKDVARFVGQQPIDLLRTRVRPLADLTLALNYRATGLAVRPLHLVNLALHLACVLAVLALALRILRRLGWPAPFATALLTAALFGLHPLQTEAVSYVYQRGEVLASLFYLLGLLLALAAEENGRSLRGLASYAGALACLALGWGSKPIVSTFPAALMLCGLAFPPPDEKRAPLARTVAQVVASLPFWALIGSLAALLFTGVRGSTEAGFELPAMTARHYFLTQPRVILTYLRLLFWPSGQNVDWDFPVSESFFEPRTALAFLLIAAMVTSSAWLWWWSAKRARDPELRSLARLAAFGPLWFLLVLAPTSSVVPILDVMAEHRVYLPSLGIFLPAAAAGVLLARRFAPGPRGAIAGCAAATAVCIALAIALYRRNAVWESGISLWSDAVAHSPGKARPHMNLGYMLMETDPERGLAERRIALDLADATVLNNVAVAQLEMGQLDDARAVALRVIARWPLYAPAHHTMGRLELARHDSAAALPHFRRAVELAPNSAPWLESLALTQHQLGDDAGACSTWSRYARSGVLGTGGKGAKMMAALGCQTR